MEVVFETTSLWTRSFFVFLIGPLFLAVGVYETIKNSKNREYTRDISNRGAFAIIVFGAVTTIFSMIIYVSFLVLCVIPYRQGDFEIVEGNVENLETTVCSNGSDEFSVNGVHFVVGYQIAPGLSEKAQCGGPIQSNGDYVRISYVSIGESNIIFKVEKEID